MKDSALRLQDKTILLVGPFNGITQACMRSLTEFGCDVGYVGFQNAHATRYVDGLNEARDVHSHYGRAGYFHLPLRKESEIMEALGRVTESLGRIDAVVDTSPMAWDATTDPSAVSLSLLLAKQCLPFLLAKQRGRLVFLFEDTCLEKIVPATNVASLRDELIQNIEIMAKEYIARNVTVNGVAVGVTDDFLLKVLPKSPSLRKSMEELQKDHPTLRLVDTHDVALGVAYLISALSSSVTGQILRLTQGYHLD